MRNFSKGFFHPFPGFRFWFPFRAKGLPGSEEPLSLEEIEDMENTRRLRNNNVPYRHLNFMSIFLR